MGKLGTNVRKLATLTLLMMIIGNSFLLANLVRPVLGASQYPLLVLVSGFGTTNATGISGPYNEGTNVTVQASPNSGYSFSHWQLDGNNSGLINPFTVTMNVSHTLTAFFTTLSQKWRTNPGGSITLIGPQAAHLVPNRSGMQIVVTGGSTIHDGEDYNEANAHGNVTVLDGTTGAIIWQKTGYPMGIHQPFEIADLNKDGQQEIVLSAFGTTIALFGNNGNLYWRVNAPSADVTPAIADVNFDGFPEVFVSSGMAPYRGNDWITSLSFDGNILNQATSWHPCFGGLTVADPSFDGHFMVFQGDRATRYGSDQYRGGGRGVRAFDALTLTPIWNDPTILCSSHAPILADVDKDGVLDVIVADQSARGIAVLNSTDGTVLTSPNGTYYRKGGTGMSAHSEPTVYDVDGDGDLELIDCTYSQPIIWDLYTWTRKGALTDENGNPLMCAEPPKIGNVTGGPGMNIIAMPDSSPQNTYVNQRNSIYIYDGNSSLVQKLTGNGLDDPRPFTLVQDVDGDGLNELVITSTSGNVYCYDTTVPTPKEGITSTSEFYSEYRRGAAEYVPPPGPNKPVLAGEQPQDGSVNQPVSPTLSVTVTDLQANLMNITFSTNATGTWAAIQSFSGPLPNNTYTAPGLGMSQKGTTYYWRCAVTDGNNHTNSRTYKFTTQPNAIIQGFPYLVSMSNGDLVTYPNGSDVGNQENVYNWYRNGTSLTNLLLPFDTLTASNPLISDVLFSDGFENSFQNWSANGATTWILDGSQAHQGSFSARSSLGARYLTSNNIDTSSADGITVSFWYRDHGTGTDDNVYLQFWNGASYNNIFKLGNTIKDIWHLYTVQTYDPQYRITNFRIRFDATSIDSGRNVWIDEVSVKAPTRTMDYSGKGNHATVYGATWTNQGVVGGAYSFDGTDDYLSLQDNPSLGGDGTWPEITVELWIKPSASLWGATVLTKRVATQNNGTYTIGFLSNTSLPANTLYWGINCSSDNAWHEISDTSTTVLQVGNWYHVVCTYKSGQGLSIYINGTLRATSQTILTGNIVPGQGISMFKQPVFIGYDGGGGRERWFSGLVDDVRIYPKSMSQFQILQRYSESMGGLSNSSTIAGQDTSIGDVWRCQVTPNNGFIDGNSIFTNNLTVFATPVQWDLFVTSDHDSPVPNVGHNSYSSGSSVVCSVTSPVTEGNFVWTCTGYTGTGSVPNGTNTSVAFTITQNSTVTWNWNSTPLQYQLVVGVVGNGSTVPSGAQMHNAGTVISVNATAGSGSVLSHWLLDGNNNGSANPFTITMNSNHTLTAVFISNSSVVWDLLVGSDHGSPVPGVGHNSYNNGSSVTCSVTTPVLDNNTVWTCTGYAGTGSVPSNGNGTSVTFTINQNSTITWNWQGTPVQYQLLIVVNGTGFTNPPMGNYNYNVGIVVSVSATANSGWVFSHWLLDGNNVGSTNPLNVTMNANHALTAVFIPVQWDLFVASAHDTPVPAVGDNFYNDGSSVTCSVTSPLTEGSTIWTCVGYNGTGSFPSSGVGSSVTFTITQNSTITWNWNSSPSSYIFSSDFETGSFSEWTGTSVTSGESATVVQTLPHSGSYSALCTTDGASAIARAYCYTNLQTSASQLYALAYVYFNRSVSLNNGNSLWLIQFRDSGGSAIASYGIIGTSQSSAAWACMYGGSNPAFSTSGPVAGVWYCIEAYFNKTASGNSLILYINGIQVASLSSNTSGANNVAQVRIGVAYNDPGYTLSLYVDTVIIDNKYIPPQSQPVQWKLTVVSAHGNPAPSVGDILYNDGSSVTCSVTSPVIEGSTVWTCTGYTGTGSVPDGAGSSVTFTITQNSTITWNWQGAPVQYQLVVGVTGSGNGSTSPSGTQLYNLGTVVLVNATASSGSVFSYWLLDGNYNGSDNPFNVTMNANHTLTAVFSLGSGSYLFTSDFEAGNFGEWTGTSVTSGESATVVQTLAFNRSYSALFTTDGASAIARAYCYENLQTSASQLYALTYVYFNSSVSLSSGNSLWLIQFRDSGGSAIASYGITGTSQSSAGWACMYGGSNPAFATSGPVAGTWYCVEAYFNKTTSGSALVIYVNGTQMASLSTNTSGANNVAQVRVGVAYNDPGYMLNLYVDTAIIDNKYIPQPS
jgi:hypothetical protein